MNLHQHKPDQSPGLWRLREDQCVGCAVCADVCPEGALRLEPGDLAPRYLAARCTLCGQCAEQCPTGAIAISPASSSSISGGR